MTNTYLLIFLLNTALANQNLLLVAVLLLDLLDLLGGWPLARRVHDTWHPRAGHRAVAIPWGPHGWSLWGHTAGGGHARSLDQEETRDRFKVELKLLHLSLITLRLPHQA